MSPVRQRGFTLIELLIAIAIFVVMAAMAYGGLSAVISSRETVTAALDRSKTMQMAVWRISRDIEQIVNRPIRDSFGDRQPAIAGSPDVGLLFTRSGWRNPLGEIRSNLQRVAYRVDENDNLVRAYWRVLDQAQDSAPVESTLVEDVSNVEWRFLDNNRQWQDRWPPDNAPGAAGLAAEALPSDVASAQYQPPLAIELRFTAPAWGDIRLLFAIAGAEK
ncbi:type II secretion system minor pseudopilin GspJ [Salinisphaera sp. T31B1]|uniref:type II secretion system minor pseudopilin GspJ n=1 Tax=Salinisphaera sp. T31B1 TaxID=727963 RepID=UPI0033401F43